MNNKKNSVQNNLDSRDLRDNFKNVKKFMDAENMDGSMISKEEQDQISRDLRDNFKKT